MHRVMSLEYKIAGVYQAGAKWLVGQMESQAC